MARARGFSQSLADRLFVGGVESFFVPLLARLPSFGIGNYFARFCCAGSQTTIVKAVGTDSVNDLLGAA